jgi:hypothetical protein
VDEAPNSRLLLAPGTDANTNPDEDGVPFVLRIDMPPQPRTRRYFQREMDKLLKDIEKETQRLIKEAQRASNKQSRLTPGRSTN